MKMKKTFSVLLVLVMILGCFYTSGVVNAAGGTFTYEFVVKADAPICAAQGLITYPSNDLRVSSCSSDYASDECISKSAAGEIKFNFTNAKDVYDFTEGKTVLSVTFYVDNSNFDPSKISGSFTEFYTASQARSSNNTPYYYYNKISGKTVTSGYADLDNPSESFEPAEELNVSTMAKSLTITSSLAVDFKVNPAVITDNGYTDPYLSIEFCGFTFQLKDYTVDNKGRYVYTLKNIPPQRMGDVISATLCANYKGVEKRSESVEYSVKQYCNNMLSKYNTDAYAKLRTLLVDVLNYGAAAQMYKGYNTDNLVNKDLSAEQLAWGTSETPTLNSYSNKEYEKIENPEASFSSMGLDLGDSVIIRFKIVAENLDNLSAEIKTGGVVISIPSGEFVPVSGAANTYYVYFKDLNAASMRTLVYATLKNGDTAVSNTVRYSIESYAANMKNNHGSEAQYDSLNLLLESMIKYGDSAKAYIS